MGDTTATTVFDLGALYELEAATSEATRRAVGDYRAIDGGPATEAELVAARAESPLAGERALAVLVARAGGICVAVSRVRVMRLAAEHLLGRALFEAVTGRGAEDCRAGGAFEDVALRPGVREHLSADHGRLALVARLPLPAVLYLLARDGLTETFAQIIADPPGELAPRRLSSLVAEARTRLGAIEAVVVAHPADHAELAAAGWRVNALDVS